MFKQFKILPQNSKQEVKFIQITDTHLLANKTHNFIGINSYNSYCDVVHAILGSTFEPEFILVTGDIAQEDSIVPYQIFKQQALNFKKPVFWLHGNHDYDDKLQQILIDDNTNIKPHKQILIQDNWQIVLLNSQVPHFVYGYLYPEQFEFLQQCLAQYPDRHSIVALHHHIFPVGSKWLDQHMLKNNIQFCSILQTYQNVRAVLFGHIHQEFTTEYMQIKYLSTPATSIQFKPHCVDFTLDTLQPAWREITLLPNGELQTVIKRLDSDKYQPDTLSKGY